MLDHLVQLHEEIRIIYVVDGYEALMEIKDGSYEVERGRGETILLALEDLSRKLQMRGCINSSGFEGAMKIVIKRVRTFWDFVQNQWVFNQNADCVIDDSDARVKEFPLEERDKIVRFYNLDTTKYYDRYGTFLWEEKMQFSRLWDVGGFFITNYVHYTILRVAVMENVQVINVETT